jgi:pimeloyl-ACP methyl ester carboxylesterase
MTLSRTCLHPVQFTSRDGLRLTGQARYGARRWLVFVHDVDQDLDAWTPLIAHIEDREFSTLAFDLRGHGASEGTWQESLADLDVEAAVKWVRDQSPSAIGLIGAGIGCMAGLAAITREPVQAFILASPAAGLAGREPETMRPATPKLLLVGRSESTAVLAANAVYQGAIGPTILIDLPVADQGAALYTSLLADQAVEQTLAFLRSYLA